MSGHSIYLCVVLVWISFIICKLNIFSYDFFVICISCFMNHLCISSAQLSIGVSELFSCQFLVIQILYNEAIKGCVCVLLLLLTNWH